MACIQQVRREKMHMYMNIKVKELKICSVEEGPVGPKLPLS